MNAVRRRVSRLENRTGSLKRRPVVRVTIQRVAYEAGIEESTCMRTLSPDGMLSEIVYWGGRPDQMTDECLDRFVEKFPIEPYAP